MWFWKRKKSRPDANDVAVRLRILRTQVGLALVAPPREILKQIYQNWSAEDREIFDQKADADRDELVQQLEQLDLWDFMTPAERDFAQATAVTMTEQQRIDGSWRLESAQVLMWALGIIDSLPPYDTMADPDLLRDLKPESVAAAQLRPQEVIDQAREMAELWHWRSRTRELIERGEKWPSDPKLEEVGLNSYEAVIRMAATNAAQSGGIPPCIGDDFPARGKPYRDLSAEEWSEVRSITMERHHALNWLCGYARKNRWDKTPTDT